MKVSIKKSCLFVGVVKVRYRGPFRGVIPVALTIRFYLTATGFHLPDSRLRVPSFLVQADPQRPLARQFLFIHLNHTGGPVLAI